MPEDFDYDVFLSHSSLDKPVVRDLAHRLRQDGLKVWFDEWEILPGDSIPSKIEHGLEHSRLLVLCMSTNAFASEWSELEAGTFRFRSPLNRDRRFLPLRLDDSPIKGSLQQFLHLKWHPTARETEYPKLLAACRRTLETSAKSQPPPPPSRGAPGATPAPQTTPRPGVSGEGLTAGGNVRLRDATGQGVSGKNIQAGGDIELTNEGGGTRPKK